MVEAAVVLLLFLPMIFVYVGISEALARRRKRKRIKETACPRCDTRLDETALELSEQVWKIYVEDLRRNRPHIRLRLIRHHHAICPSCGLQLKLTDSGWIPVKTHCSLHDEPLKEEIDSPLNPILDGLILRYGEPSESKHLERFPNSRLWRSVSSLYPRPRPWTYCGSCRQAELDWLREKIEEDSELEAVVGSKGWCTCPGCSIRFQASLRSGSWWPAVRCGSCGTEDFFGSHPVREGQVEETLGKCPHCRASLNHQDLSEEIGLHTTCGQRIRLTRSV